MPPRYTLQQFYLNAHRDWIKKKNRPQPATNLRVVGGSERSQRREIAAGVAVEVGVGAAELIENGPNVMS